jgi:CheY-like chemotaxis protein
MVAPDNLSGPENGIQQQPHGFIGGKRKELNASKIVLIVDDDPDLLEVTSFVLEGEGFSVETAKDGEEALQRLRVGKLPAVVLLDLMMPVMNGYQFLEEVAKVPSLKEIPVVVLTAASLMEVPRAVEVVHKPMDLGLLIKLVERYAHGAG